jgi:ubiquinone/menaquinone biosynthesis C-methylase UbiE
MLSQAQLQYPDISFLEVKNGRLPVEPKIYDLIFSSFVLFELETKEMIGQYLQEAKRVIKDDGLLVAVTGSQELHSASRKWLIFESNFPENKSLKSGNLVKLYLKCANIEFTDYYWEEKDYVDCFEKSGFEIKEIIRPLGKKKEGYSWEDELIYPPFIIVVAVPTKNRRCD